MEFDELNYEQQYEAVNFSPFVLDGLSFEDCSFTSCKFENVPIRASIFTGCSFSKCSFLLTKVDDTTFNDVLFKDCRLMGVNFTTCNDFLLNFEFADSILDNVFISEKKLQKIKIRGCTLKDCDFMRVDFRSADFEKTVFNKVNFSECNLEKADFRKAENYSINPESNRIKNARFSLPEAQSFLAFLGIRIDD